MEEWLCVSGIFRVTFVVPFKSGVLAWWSLWYIYNMIYGICIGHIIIKLNSPEKKIRINKN